CHLPSQRPKSVQLQGSTSCIPISSFTENMTKQLLLEVVAPVLRGFLPADLKFETAAEYLATFMKLGFKIADINLRHETRTIRLKYKPRRLQEEFLWAGVDAFQPLVNYLAPAIAANIVFARVKEVRFFSRTKTEGEIELLKGVNLISTYRSQSWKAVKGTCEIGSLAPSGTAETPKAALWWYDPSTKDWVEISTTTDLDPTRGYFVSVEADCDLQLDPTPAGESHDFKSGWNLFSVLNKTTWQDVRGTCHSKYQLSGRETIFGVDELHKFRELSEDEPLYPYHGYLVAVNSDCKPVLAISSGATAANIRQSLPNRSSYTASLAVPEDIIPPFPEPEKIPTAPSSLLAAPGDGNVNLTWQDNAVNETGYAVERREQGGTFTYIATGLSADTERYNHAAPGEGTYCYRVLAFNEHGASLPSEEACITSTGGLSVKVAVAQHSGNSALIEDEDILWAINFWISGAEVPGTGGKTISDSEILELIQLWISQQPVSSASTEGPAKGQTREALAVERMLVSSVPLDGHGLARFVADGQGIRDMNVQVFSLAGQEIFDSGFVSGHELSWNLLNNQGRAVANGVYLYVVRVRGLNGELYVSEVRKLVILR
ncbi:MAG: hypothetical protein NUW06_07770, partial [Candidatus Acetothermia bacterium]|nr:hypothetical protein [Candidatus Acetothermia bacterium]